MKSFNLPIVTTKSLGNSLFECVMIDAQSKPATGSEPARIQMGAICVCLRGTGTFTINDHTYKVAKGDMITILPNTVVGGTSSSDDFLGYALAVDMKVLMNIQMKDVVRSFVHISDNPVLRISDEQISTIVEMCELLKRKQSQPHPFGEEISKSLLMVISYEIHSFYLQNGAGDVAVRQHRTRQGSLCQQFLKLVDENASTHRDMGFYADRLCITPKYLSVVVRKVSGYSPVEWIDRAVMLYARTLLSSSDLTVQQIAAELNFANPSFFGQYFKRHEGVTPKHYRNMSNNTKK